MSEDKKDELFSEHLCYMGKVLAGKGTTKDKTTGQDKEWKKWKLNFESGKQYPWQCTAWNNLTGKGVLLDAMKEGDYYEVVYKWNEYQHDEHGLVKSKVAVLVKESSEDKSTQASLGQNKSSGSSGASSGQSKKAAADNWVAFAKEYKELAGEKANSMHMLGAYVANKHQEQFGDIITLCKKEFDKKPLNLEM